MFLFSAFLSEKSNLKKKKKQKQKQNKQTNNVIVYDEFYTQKYVFKITYQIPSHVKIGPFFIFKFRIWIQERENQKWIHHFLEPNRALL